MSTKSNLNSLRIIEKYELTSATNILVKLPGEDKIVRLTSQDDLEQSSTSKNFFHSFFREVFLPQGYPKTVSEDYFEYQFYDTIQAFCSRITGTIATKAILKGVGVGNAEATALAAAITWIFKDGTGMFGGIVFAWWKGTDFDSDCKKWRLFADILNDLAMFIELLLPKLPKFSIPILCLTTCMKSAVGVAGGATRAAITQHQAIVGNSADVSAKDGSQETAVNLVASIFGILVLTFIEEGRYEWSIFVIFTAMHLLANYLAVSSLVFQTLNPSRLIIILKTYCRFDAIPEPENVNRSESVVLGYGINAQEFCGFDIKLGESLKIATQTMEFTEFEGLLQVYKSRQYLIIPNMRDKNIIVVLVKSVDSEMIIQSYFHSIILGLALNILNNTDVEYIQKKTTINDCVLKRLERHLENADPANILENMKKVDEFVASESKAFIEKLKSKDWNLNMHSLQLHGWRLENFEFK